MSEARSTHGGDEKWIQKTNSETFEERAHLRDVADDRTMILNRNVHNRVLGLDQIELAQDRIKFGFSWSRKRDFEFHKSRLSWPAE